LYYFKKWFYKIYFKKYIENEAGPYEKWAGPNEPIELRVDPL
jgi:hypothetical protein